LYDRRIPKAIDILSLQHRRSGGPIIPAACLRLSRDTIRLPHKDSDKQIPVH